MASKWQFASLRIGLLLQAEKTSNIQSQILEPKESLSTKLNLYHKYTKKPRSEILNCFAYRKKVHGLDILSNSFFIKLRN